METGKTFLIILYFFISVSSIGLAVFISENFMDEKNLNNLAEGEQKIKISIPEVAPAVLSGKWKFIK